ncbi:MAG: competence/damage-inducible protein A [Alicyclobacillaceae bacterium]|nr:competence/damage-inducible protein A [Alicyclobacillaceae bacterium]
MLCRAELVAVGSELLLGQINNSHAQYISAEFAKEGFFVYHHSAVGDNLERVVAAFRLAAARSNVVVVTGGLGPTDDDLTKEALAKFLGRDMHEDAESLRHLLSYFAHRNRPMPEANRKQALSIVGGQMLENPNGTAPGQYVEDSGVHFFLLPGPPLEMKPMLANQVLPRLRAIFGAGDVVRSRIVRFCGIGESDVDESVRDLTQGQNPTVAPLAGEGEMLLRITAHATSEEQALAKIAPIETELRRRFPNYIYGVDDDSLVSVTLSRLTQKSATLSVAESCTGGLLGAMLTSQRGSSSAFVGGVISYANDVKVNVLGVPQDVLERYGAVSAETAEAMAVGVQRVAKSDFAISITGIAGPDGGTPEKPVGLVYVGLVNGRQEVQTFRMQFRGSREQIRIRAAKQALWRLWQAMQTDDNVV